MSGLEALYKLDEGVGSSEVDADIAREKSEKIVEHK
jgi:hypothetical protein